MVLSFPVKENGIWIDCAFVAGCGRTPGKQPEKTIQGLKPIFLRPG
jgi:hypothetical protein